MIPDCRPDFINAPEPARPRESGLPPVPVRRIIEAVEAWTAACVEFVRRPVPPEDDARFLRPL